MRRRVRLATLVARLLRHVLLYDHDLLRCNGVRLCIGVLLAVRLLLRLLTVQRLLSLLARQRLLNLSLPLLGGHGRLGGLWPRCGLSHRRLLRHR